MTTLSTTAPCCVLANRSLMPRSAGTSNLAGDVSTIGAVARYGPPDDFHNRPTQHANYDMGEEPRSDASPRTASLEPSNPFQQPEPVDPLDQETEPTPWYRRPVALLIWALAVTILIALIVYGISELIGEGQGPSRAPSSTTTTPTTTTPSTTTTTPTTTEPTTEPSTSSAVEPPPPQPTQQPTRQQTQAPTHRHHIPQLPSVITIPGGPTIPVPGLP